MVRDSSVRHSPPAAQKGALALALTAVLLLVAAIIGGWMLKTTAKTKQGVTESSAGTMVLMKQAALDFVRQNKRLPTVGEFNALTQANINNIGRKAIYLVDDRFAKIGNNVCNLAHVGLLQVADCSGDVNCASPAIVQNLGMVLIDGGQNVLSLADPVHQSSSRTTSLSIDPTIANSTPYEIVRRYASGVAAGNFLNSTLNRVPYDDLIDFASVDAVKEAAGCGLVSQGDVIASGGDLRILNDSLPDATLNAAYPKTIVAYGRDAATYAFSVTAGALPPGLLIETPVGKTAAFGGVPTATGVYNFTMTVTATAAGYSRSASRPLTLRVTACPNWVDSGPPTTEACPSGYTGAITKQLQTDACSSATRINETSNSCACVPTWSDSGSTGSVACPSGETGTVTEKEQIESCTNNRRWVESSRACTPTAPTFATCSCGRIFGFSFDITSPANPKCTNACCTTTWGALASKPPCPLFTGCTFPATCP